MKANIKMKTGDILHCSRNTLVSRLIMWFTKGKYSHTAVAVECWGQIYIVDAQSDGVQPKPLEHWIKKYKYKVIVARPRTGPKDPKTFCIKAFSRVSVQKYDMVSLLLVHPIYAITGKWLAKGDPNRRADICSEYVARLYNIEDPYKMTPKKMYDYTINLDFIHFEYRPYI